MYGNGYSRGVVHYSDVVMSPMTPQITGAMIVYSTVCAGADQRKHQSSASLAFVRGYHRWPVNSPLKGPVTRKMFPFDDVIMDIAMKAEPAIGGPAIPDFPLYKYTIFIFKIFPKFKYLHPSLLLLMPCIKIVLVLFLSGLIKWSALVMNI